MSPTIPQVESIFAGVVRRPVDNQAELLFGTLHASTTDLINYLKGTSENLNGVVPAIRAYQWVLGRRPDASGLNFWAGAIRAGTQSVSSAYANFLASSEGAARYPSSHTNDAFVSVVFTNVLGRTATPADIAYFSGQVALLGRATVLAQIGESSEAQTRINGLISTWQTQAGNGTASYTGSFF